MNLDVLDKAAVDLTTAAARYDSAYAAALTRLSSGAASPDRAEKLRAINASLTQAERALTSPEGLSGRPWYRHLLYAPGFYTGYGVKTVPAVREAIEQHQWSRVEPEAARVAQALGRESKLLDDLTKQLNSLQ
jgi:N-acetylated-alpha-linked acidic dipeptidase